MRDDDQPLAGIIRVTLVAVIGWLVCCVLLYSCSARAAAGTAVYVRMTVWDSTQGPQKIACTARQGVTYAWDAVTGFTVKADCWPMVDSIFSNGFDP